jgi:hypothetical protein
MGVGGFGERTMMRTRKMMWWEAGCSHLMSPALAPSALLTISWYVVKVKVTGSAGVGLGLGRSWHWGQG